MTKAEIVAEKSLLKSQARLALKKVLSRMLLRISWKW